MAPTKKDQTKKVDEVDKLGAAGALPEKHKRLGTQLPSTPLNAGTITKLTFKKPIKSILGGYKVAKLEGYTATKKKANFAHNLEHAVEFKKTEAPSRVGEKMAEPRARAARHKGQLNFGSELKDLLYAFGDVENPLDETVRVLDEITTDFIIETCHAASAAATYAGRQKVKNEDFLFAIRKNETMLGRTQELFQIEREQKEARKQFDTGEGKVGLERGGKKKGKNLKEEEAMEEAGEEEGAA